MRAERRRCPRRSWRRALLLALLLVPPVGSAVGADLFAALGVTRPRVRLPVPALRLPALAGGKIALSSYRGRLVLLNFWGMFCPPCREEMPTLQDVWRRYRARGVVVLAVSEDRTSRRRIAAYVRRYAYTFPILLDPDGGARRRYAVDVLPVTYLIGTGGRFLGRVVGARNWAGPKARALISSLLPDR
jgi:peroxiredoxin